MADTFSIMISNSQTGVVLVTATVEIHEDMPRLTEIRTEPDAEGLVPQALSHIDFPFLVRTANFLSSTPLGVPSTVRPEVSGKRVDPQGPERTQVDSAPEFADSQFPGGAAKPIDETREQSPLRNAPKVNAPADFGVTYWRLGSIAKVSRHYDVPHYIAQDWIKSLQQQGKLANPWPSKSSRLRPQ
ncbi:hypothetical protein AB0F85_31935 [Nocardia fluminea]|uniref:hypothetical protein n=1 Tax=Nocardia fluminea TaxID=134984 RepID=UPI0033D566F8